MEKHDMKFRHELKYLCSNGEYAGLYLVSQHVDVTGGNVDITDLGQKNSDINNYETIMSSISEISEEGHRVTYFDGISPSDISGGYLMEFVSPTYSGQEASFSTDHQRILIESPKYATKEEVYYISEYINNVEDAIFDRTDSVYRDYIDMESWTSMYLLREFFFSWDVENNSSYMYKDSGSDVLYCGPAWDYDLSMGQTYGCHSNYTSQVIWLEGKENISWLYSLMKNHPDFEEEVIQKYYTELLPFMNDELNNKMPSMYEHIKSSAEMDYIRYPSEMRLHYKGNFDEEYNYLTDWLCARRDFYSDYFKNENEYICVRFEGRNLFAYYIKPGDVINEIPLEAGNVVTWIYAETGEELKIGDIINESTVLEIKE